MRPLLLVLTAYLLGSIPFGYLLVRMAGRGDVRETGSGGTGATNVTRRAGRGAGVLTLVLDALKGALAVALARWLLAPDFAVNWWVAACALAVVLGHVFPLWLGFRGGKGVATGLGVFLVLAPWAVACAALVFLLIVWRTRYVSLGSVVASATLPLAVWLVGAGRTGANAPTGLGPLLTTALAGCALIILMHRANIGRLLRGTENRI